MDAIDQNTPTAPATAAPDAPAPDLPATQLPAAPEPPAAPAPAHDATDTGDAPPATFGPAAQYQATGHAGLDMALAFVGKHGLGAEHPAIVTAGTGDFGPLKALLAEKGVPGWEAHVALAEAGYQHLVAQEAERINAVQQIAEQAAGSAQAWNEALAWAADNAEPHERDAVNAALDAGGITAEAMAAYLVQQHRAASGTRYAPATPAVKPQATRGANNPANGALSPAEYGKAVAALSRSKGATFEQTAEYRQLQSRRVAWRG